MPDYSENRLIVRLRGFDARHYAKTRQYARQVERLYNTACDEIARAAGRITIPADGVFSFDDFPATRRQAEGILSRLTKKVEAVITTGTRTEWQAACDKSDAFLGSILRTSRLTPEEAEKYQARNLEALQAFQQRKAGGLGLSQRVWKYTEEFKTALELGIDVAVGEGRSAQQLSRDLRQYLQQPDKLFRRVRDKGGNLRLSKAAKMYHPGQGVYRSAAKNAERLARTEVNMAYREAEYLRWQQLDFVVGFRVMLSNNHTTKDSKGKTVPLTDICDELAGDYPKTFKFLGWHPQCRCVVVPIMSDYDEFNKDRANRLKAIVRGQSYKSLPSRRTVRDVPAAFRSHIEAIADRSKNWKAMPYYIRDNFKNGVISGGLLPSIPQKTQMPGTTAKPPEPCTEFDREIANFKTWAYTFGLDVSALDVLRTSGDREGLKAEIKRLQGEQTARRTEWIHYRSEVEDFAGKATGYDDVISEIDKELNATKINTSNYYGDCISRLKAFFASLPGKLEDAKAKATKTKLTDAISILDKAKVEHRSVSDLPKALTDAEIIAKVGGGDKTSGSCASAAFAYAGNKLGFDTRDFRGGDSMRMFSRNSTLDKITENVGGVVVRNGNDFKTAKELLAKTVEGKEYYFGVGQHVAIIRKTATGYEYLELQSSTSNGWKKLTTEELRHRFGCKKSHTRAGMKHEVSGELIDLDLLKSDGGFKKLLGYLNTAEDKQLKGVGGTTK